MIDKAPAALAREGDLNGLVSCVRSRGGPHVDRDLYRWLCAAADFGHEEADDMISDLLEHGSLRYDDDGWEQAAAHWELAIAYLRGADGFDCDLELGEVHLDLAFRFRPGREVLEQINAGTNERFSANDAKDGMTGEARRVLESALDGDPKRRLRHVLERVERLKEVSAPQIILENERTLLRDALTMLDEKSLDDETRQRVSRAKGG
jgi:hypothetical protein